MPTNIPYLDEVWQPVTGCSPCSPGCENCYASVQASGPRLRDHRRYTGLAADGKWTGEVRCNVADLQQPLRWRTPRVIGTCFMGDLFAESVPWQYLDRVFTTMTQCPQHTFVVCTKRAERMREYFSGRLPLPNCHLGVTTESQEQSLRVSDLIATTAAHRWLSVEPMLGPLDLSWLTDRCKSDNGQGDRCTMAAGHKGNHNALTPTGGWGNEGPCESPISGVIVGCESGLNRRPCKLEWVRKVVEDCQAAGVKCYVKQLDIGGKVVKDIERFPEWAQVRHLPWMAESEVA